MCASESPFGFVSLYCSSSTSIHEKAFSDFCTESIILYCIVCVVVDYIFTYILKSKILENIPIKRKHKSVLKSCRMTHITSQSTNDKLA